MPIINDKLYKSNKKHICSKYHYKKVYYLFILINKEYLFNVIKGDNLIYSFLCIISTLISLLFFSFGVFEDSFFFFGLLSLSLSSSSSSIL